MCLAPVVIRPAFTRTPSGTMQSLGVDMSGHYAKHVREFTDRCFDFVVTVCDLNHEVRPTIPDRDRAFALGFCRSRGCAGLLRRARRYLREVARRIGDRVARFVEDFVRAARF